MELPLGAKALAVVSGEEKEPTTPIESPMTRQGAERIETDPGDPGAAVNFAAPGGGQRAINEDD